MAMLKYGNAVTRTPIVSPGKWIDQKVPQSRVKVAKQVIGKFDPSQWLLSHCTIMAAVDVEPLHKDPKKNFLIKPEYSMFVNNNGDSWERELLRHASKSFLGADNFCFVAGTRILMADATYKPIEEIKEGDKVINRKGQKATVTKTFRRKSDDLVEISGRGILSRSLFVTKNHPFWVYKARKTCPKTGRPNSFDRDKNYSSLDSWVGFSPGVHRAKGEYYPCGVVPDWVEAGDLDANRNFLTHPVSSVEMPNEEINENRAELIGWFLAEGFFNTQNKFSDEESGVSFALGNDEIDVADRLSDLLTTEFGQHFRADCKPRLYETQSGSHMLSLSNREAARFFKKWCGKYAWAKKMPEEAMWLPKELQAIIIKACLLGDGCGTIDSRGYSLELKSKFLIQQILWMCWRLGLSPTYRETGVLKRYSECEIIDGFEIFSDPDTGKKSRPGYYLRFSTRDSKALNLAAKKSDNAMSKRASRRRTHLFENEESKWILSRIESIKPVDVSCEVHNIEVEGDNSYIAEGISVHNCEHVQIASLSKGKVIDVALREVPFTKDQDGNELTVLYVDLLIATNKKHTDIIEKINSGEYSYLSMGCSIEFSVCSQCGNLAVDDAQACKHVKYFKNNFFYDKNGVKRIIAELCGSSDKPDSCKFCDASWVRKPAFEGAILRNVLQAVGDNENVSEKIQKAVQVPSFEAQPGMQLRAASQAAQTIVNEVEAQEEGEAPAPPKDDAGFPEAPADTEKPLEIDKPPEEGGGEAKGEGEAPAEEGGGEAKGEGEAPAEGGGEAKEEAPAEGGGEAPAESPEAAPGAAGGAPGEQKPPEPQIEEPADDATVKEVKQLFKKQILNELRRDLLKQQAKTLQKDRPAELETMENKSLVKDASFKKLLASSNKTGGERLKNALLILSNLKDWKNFKKYGYNRNDVLGVLHYVDLNLSKNPVGRDAVRALSKIKTANSNLVPLFTEIIIETGRKPERHESKKIAAWAKILRYFEK